MSTETRTQSSPIDDRRHYERISTERPVTLLMNEESSLQGKMIDLSSHGAGVVVHSNCLTGDEIQVSFRLPTTGETSLVLSAIVTHSSSVRGDCLLGLEFTGIIQRYETAINEFIRYHRRLD